MIYTQGGTEDRREAKKGMKSIWSFIYNALQPVELSTLCFPLLGCLI
jgi:hypothetical protein